MGGLGVGDIASSTVLPSIVVSPHELVWTVVVAGGSGSRLGRAKQFEPLVGEQRVVDVAVATAASVCDGVVLVVPASAVEEERRRQHCTVVAGGSSRTASVRAGLEAVPAEARIICVHDAARPLATAALFELVVAEVRRGSAGAIPALGVNDTIKVVVDGRVDHTPDRTTLMAVQTPQAFEAGALREAHRVAEEHGVEGTDDASLLEQLGRTVAVVPGEADNRKITITDDLDWVRSRLAAGATAVNGAEDNLTER